MSVADASEIKINVKSKSDRSVRPTRAILLLALLLAVGHCWLLDLLA